MGITDALDLLIDAGQLVVSIMAVYYAQKNAVNFAHKK